MPETSFPRRDHNSRVPFGHQRRNCEDEEGELAEGRPAAAATGFFSRDL